MKNIKEKLIDLFKKGYCTPQIARVAKEIKEPSTTIHYNIKKMEKDGEILAYNAVFDYKKIGQGFCAFALLTLSPDEYGNPERIGVELAKFPQIESVDIITGDWEMIIKVRTRDMDEYYDFVKKAISRKGVLRICLLYTSDAADE